MKIYDKASWHIDGGERKEDVIKKFSLIFDFLEKEGMLTDEGKEILELGIDTSISLHERMVNEKGKILGISTGETKIIVTLKGTLQSSFK